MKKYSTVMLSAIFTALIVGSIQSIVAVEPELVEDDTDSFLITSLTRNSSEELEMLALDAMLGIKEAVKETTYGNFILTRNFEQPTEDKQSLDSKYEIHLLVVVRDTKGQLVSVSESTSAWYLPDKFTDSLFESMSDEREIITFNNLKYEKVQKTIELSFSTLSFTPTTDTILVSSYPLGYCAHFKEYGYNCVPAWFAHTSAVVLAEDYVATIYWTILRAMN